ncbi:DNA mismatch repair endonuclease MutL [Lentilactobacillus senioris]|uniref:DNA mismatch repair endonuclease MutL n=1 Tax=Lentilactobacillus senioris TaxID=931534 RepID=UPI0006D28E44|nr:DNA mismatch repair endonuclease MutL [Lentilactobacillus senioris]
MAKIHELPVLLADQIAAGEVVERPASVVKELVENAVDANSTEINVNVESAGLKVIQVIDNGDGIAGDEVQTAFLRHATSKIAEQRDLFRVKTLGFRGGEALPSINSVSDLTIETSTGDVGTQLQFKGGKLVSQGIAAPRKGTTVTVNQLFYNTPARLKYLKSPGTELSQITDVINRLAISYPQISFSFTSDGRELLRTAGRGQVDAVLGAIYGQKNLNKLVPITKENLEIQVTGYTSLPELTRASRKYMSLILNGRYIRNYQLSRAIVDGYGSKLMVGRYPISVINITVDPALVDVNVHPTKQEVRISNEQEIMTLISQAVDAAVSPQVRIPQADPVPNLSQAISRPKPIVAESSKLPANTAPMLKATDPTAVVEPIIITNKAELDLPTIQRFDEQVAKMTASNNEVEEQPVAPISKPEDLELFSEETKDTKFPELRYIGQLHGTYLLTENQNGLYLVDQHAAQERVNYEYYRKAIGEVSDDQQRLMVPIVLDYSTSDFLLISERLDLLANLGIYLEEFGQNSFILREHPTWFKAGQEEDTVREMIDWILTDHHISVAAYREKTAIMMSCKRAIKANHHLDDQQAKALLERLPECENPYNCPHGRPVLVEITTTEIEKMFKRIQDSHDSKEF